jgi:single-stranded-DNA-specific exonuclease
MGEALVRHLGENVDSYQRAFVDLAAIGTVTDMMPLLNDNRVFVTYGLDALRRTKKEGIQALMRSAGIHPNRLTARDLGFGIGPRLNAAGRVDDSDLSLQLLLTRDQDEAKTLAEKLETANTARRAEQERVLMEALNLLGEAPDSGFLVVAGKNWNSGIVGLVAGKLVERFHRPAIVISTDADGKLGRGSARSIGAYNVHEAMTDCSEHLLDFGGHALAAGLSLELANLDDFRKAMNDRALEVLTEEDLMPCLDADLEIDPALVTFPLMQELKQFEPWGCGNEEPVLISRDLKIQDVKRIGKESQHLKLVVTARGLLPTDACWWGRGDLADRFNAGDMVSVCYRPDLNHYNGQSRVQFVLYDVRAADTGQ